MLQLAPSCGVSVSDLLRLPIPGAPAFAHEVRPAYLDLREEAPGIFDVLFKTPMRGDARLALNVSFSGRVQTATPVISRMTDNAMVQTWRLSAIEPLAGQRCASTVWQAP